LLVLALILNIFRFSVFFGSNWKLQFQLESSEGFSDLNVKFQWEGLIYIKGNIYNEKISSKIPW